MNVRASETERRPMRRQERTHKGPPRAKPLDGEDLERIRRSEMPTPRIPVPTKVTRSWGLVLD